MSDVNPPSTLSNSLKKTLIKEMLKYFWEDNIQDIRIQDSLSLLFKCLGHA